MWTTYMDVVKNEAIMDLFQVPIAHLGELFKNIWDFVPSKHNILETSSGLFYSKLIARHSLKKATHSSNFLIVSSLPHFHSFISIVFLVSSFLVH